MTRAEFFGTMQRRIIAFNEHWLKRQCKEPDLYPETLAEEDWHEQFALFVSIGVEK